MSGLFKLARLPSTASLLSKYKQPVILGYAMRFASGRPEKTEFEKRAIEVLRGFDKIDPAKLTLDANFSKDLGLDSLDSVEVLMAIEDEFLIEIPDQDADNMQTLREAVDFVYERWTPEHFIFLTFSERKVLFPDGKVISWDVVGHQTQDRPTFVVVVPWDSVRNTFCLIREYAQGPNQMLYGFVSGAFDKKKHAGPRECAVAELSEEAGLTGGTLIPLIDDESCGIPELKWGTNTFVPYLVIDPVVDPKPQERDLEEYIDIVPALSKEEILQLLEKGEMMSPSVQAFIMALRKLKKLGHLKQCEI